jgi:hypothetical protein
MAWLFIDKKITVYNDKILNKLWEDIYNEYLGEFGLSDNYEEILKQKKKIASLQADYLITGDRILINYVNIEKEQLKVLTKRDKTKDITFREGIAQLEKSQGFKINTRQLSVADYYNYLISLKNG